MFAATSRVGNIFGWTPAHNRNDILYTTTIPTPARPSSALHPGSSVPSVPRATRSSVIRSHSLDSHVSPRATFSPSSTPADSTANTDTSDYAGNNENATPDDFDWVTISPYSNATSLRRYKAKRSKDPTWAPRPPNAFILFRRNYVEENKGKAVANEKTTLSHRAGVAWKALPPDEQKIWFDKAKEEAAEHLRRNPDYAFRPNKKTRSEARRHPSLPTRREQVAEYARRADHRAAVERVRSRRHPAAPTTRAHTSASANATDTEGELGGYTTPGSFYSTSPEPPGTPYSHASAASSQADIGLELAADDAIPRAHVACPIPIPLRPSVTEGGHVLMATGTSAGVAASMPPLSRSYSYTDGVTLSSPYDYLTYDDCYVDSDEHSVNSLDSLSSPASVYWGDASPRQLSPNGFSASLQMPEPITMPSSDMVMPPHASTSASYYPPPSISSSGPLIERRRRSATTSMIPSPLSVVTSSLGGWSRDDLVTSRLASRGGVPSHSPLSLPQTHVETVSLRQVDLTTDGVWLAPHTPEMEMQGSMGGMLQLPAEGEHEYDRTPRASLFPQHAAHPHHQHGESPTHLHAAPVFPHPQAHVVHGLPHMQYPEIAGGDGDITMLTESFDLADLESYNLGLRHAGIGGAAPESLAVGPSQAGSGGVYGSPGGFEDVVDYNALYAGHPPVPVEQQH